MTLVCATLTDLVVIAYAYAAAAIARILTGAPTDMAYTLAYCLPAFAAFHVACLAAFMAYDFSKMRNESDLAFSAAFGVLGGTALSFVAATVAIVYYVPAAQPVARSVFLAACALNLILLPGWRVWYTRQRRKRGDLRGRVIVVGSMERVRALADEIQEYSRGGHQIVGCVIAEHGKDPDLESFLGHVADLPKLVEDNEADEILVLGDLLSTDPRRLLEITELCEKTHVRVHILPGLYEAMVARLDLYEIAGVPLIELKGRPLSGTYGAVKRAMDIVCALFGMAALSPVLLAAVIAIKRDSPGPAFYRQVRYGRHGREFEIIKLRTMRVDAEKDTGPVWAAKNDPRMTRVGEFLRTKRIDEIPQLWNILKGDMSLVGPRPERPHFIRQFSKDLPLFPLRLRVRPGVTALSHVWGRYDSTPADRLRYDLVYISNISFMLDVRILIDTVKIVLTGRGAQ